eukprot:6181321-Pleurochrysis_carterae.AAC.2
MPLPVHTAAGAGMRRSSCTEIFAIARMNKNANVGAEEAQLHLQVRTRVREITQARMSLRKGTKNAPLRTCTLKHKRLRERTSVHKRTQALGSTR